MFSNSSAYSLSHLFLRAARTAVALWRKGICIVKDFVAHDGRWLTELGSRTLEAFILVHIFRF
ncbi:hypothetical protein SLEP1_g264 [Rubroshorea leprosula]|uniref:Uncharacterized protein n=1 Tax=Rubroshorea leprosula TaxID=152421 RepID=A0AAV5HFV4_9ROSI|nr:hypothetical protein SLEP1_g264 [Rubroshorea leprosula]